MQGLDAWLPIFYPNLFPSEGDRKQKQEQGNGHATHDSHPNYTNYPTVLAVETHGAHSLAESVANRTLTTLPSITSAATSLGCRRVTPQAFQYALRPSVIPAVLPDAEAAMGCWRLADDERIMVELACGVNVALCYDGRLEGVLGRKLRPDDKVVVVLCGGSGVTVQMLAEWRSEFGAQVEDGVKNKEAVPSEVTMP